MARITVNLEPLANLYNEGPDLAKAIVKNAVACEMAGADGVLISTGREFDHRRRKTISILIDSLNIGVTVKSRLDEKHLEELQDLKPPLVIIPYDPDKKESLPAIVTNLQVENILVALEIPLELELVKQAAKFKCDYVVLDCQAYCNARNLGSQLDELNKIGRTAALGSRLSVGTIASGQFEAPQLSKLNQAVRIEEFVLGLPLFSAALTHGYAKAMDIIRSAIA